MSQLQKYVAIGPLRAAHPGDEINEHIWYAAPEVDAARAEDKTRLRIALDALKDFEKDAYNHSVHGRIINWTDSILKARKAIEDAS